MQDGVTKSQGKGNFAGTEEQSARRGSRDARQETSSAEPSDNQAVSPQNDRSDAAVVDSAAIDQFAYIVSHDLREPLRGISTHINFLNREPLSSSAQKRVERIDELARHADELISDLLQFSRVNRGELHRQITNVDTLIRDIEPLFDIFADNARARLVIANRLSRVRASRAHVGTIFTNLIDNGLVFNLNELRLVEVGEEPLPCTNFDSTRDDVVCFYVKDNGIGIDPKYHEKIFQIFTRLHPRKTYQSGTGIGLALVEKIVGLYGCEISVESALGCGTTIRFSLPAV
jgi:signal transduction histidine kinase